MQHHNKSIIRKKNRENNTLVEHLANLALEFNPGISMASSDDHDSVLRQQMTDQITNETTAFEVTFVCDEFYNFV